jgi:3-dehydroquinate synthetase
MTIVLHCRPAGEPASEVRIGAGLRRELGQWTAGRSALALVDRSIAHRFADALAPHWQRHDVDAGETLKTFTGLEAALRAMAQAGLDRASLLLAIGGGSIGDLGGLAASLFLRGIELWQVPTTLLAMIDSAVGGKTAINLPEGKNLVGTVHPARLVVIDLDFALSLPDTEFRSGLAEALKMAIGLDAPLFAFLAAQRERVLARDPAALLEVVRASVAAKIAVVESDLRETGRRRLLNLGHTLGHALEAHSGWRLPHGLCVARGLHFALDVAEQHAAMAPNDLRTARELLLAYGYARSPLPATAELLPFLARDKKMENGSLHFAMPTAIGCSAVRPLQLEQLRAILG